MHVCVRGCVRACAGVYVCVRACAGVHECVLVCACVCACLIGRERENEIERERMR